MRTEVKVALILGLFGIIAAALWQINSTRPLRQSTAACEACGGTGRVAVIEKGP